MKIAAGFIYLLWTVIYLSPFVPGNALWYGLDKAVQSLFVGVLCYFIQEQCKNENEKLFFEYVKWLSIASALYLLACMYYGVSFAIFNTPIFAYITGITLIVFMVHCALKKHD